MHCILGTISFCFSVAELAVIAWDRGCFEWVLFVRCFVGASSDLSYPERNEIKKKEKILLNLITDEARTFVGLL